MADINYAPRSEGRTEARNEPALREAIELLFFAYRDFTGEPDALLARHRFGRAHHRVIYFVGRQPGVTVSKLLAILKITKQSLAPVLKALVARGFIAQATGAKDRRQRQLTLTDKGLALEARLYRIQSARIARAYRQADPAAIDGFRRVMRAITDDPRLGRSAP
jgi:DNA-binding MarR family transcriptional regulator